MLKRSVAKIFCDYAQSVFMKFLETQLQNVNRRDIVWDEYIEDSLKAATKSTRSKGVRRGVEATTKLPGNWESVCGSITRPNNTSTLPNSPSQQRARIKQL